jgi:SH3-like domain-containing protein
MGIRFRKSLRIMPGVKLNLSKSGVSTSLGRPGATINLGPRGSRATVGIPGAGLSYNTPFQGGTGSAGNNSPAQGCLGANGCAGLIVLVILLALIGMCSSSPGATDNTQSDAGGAAETAYAAAKAVNCRAEPTKSSAVSSVLQSGDNAPVVDRRSGWTKLDVPAGACWVSSSLLSATAPIAAVDTSSVQSLVGSSAQTSERVSRPRSRHSASSGSHRSSARRRQRSRDSYNSEGCPCSGSNVCIGPRGGRYCITSGGNKRYGV